MVNATSNSTMKCVGIDDSGYLNRSLNSFFNKLSESSKENRRTLSPLKMDSYNKFISEPILNKLSSENRILKCNGGLDSSKFNSQGAFDLMKQLINSDGHINSDSEGNHSLMRDTDSPVSIHSSCQTESVISKDDANGPYCESVEDNHQTNLSLEVTETYQLGFRKKSSKKSSPDKVVVHFPVCIEAMEVNYPVSCSFDADGVPQVPVDYPPILLTKDRRKDLSNFVMQNLTLICDHVNSYYAQLDEEIKAVWIEQQLLYDDEIVQLRKQTFSLLLRLMPDLDVVKSFDCTSPDLERLLDCICDALTANDDETLPIHSDKLSLSPQVVLYSDCKDALQFLKEKLFRTLCLMLPDLVVPESFSAEADISELLESIYTCT